MSGRRRGLSSEAVDADGDGTPESRAPGFDGRGTEETDGEDASSTGAGLYVHVPFCSAVCPYCDFAVMVGGDASRRRYVAALLAEIRRAAEGDPTPMAGFTPLSGTASDGAAPLRDPRTFDTVYFGGGTPSALAEADLTSIFAALRETFSEPVRTHFEANPEDVTPAAAAAWRGLGVHTLSLGVQSFHPGALRFLGRRHEPARAQEAVATARRGGLGAVSIDLIYGWPGQSEAEWRSDLEAAVALGPEHLSCYGLTVEPGTPFGRRRERGELVEMPEPRQAALFRLTHSFLADHGYAAYEVSNFARAPEHRSRHNQKYWNHTPYLGLGPSAHSFDGGRERWWNHRRLAAWAADLDRGEAPRDGRETLTLGDLALERLMLGLRTTAGIDLAAFHRRYGIDLEATDGRRLDSLEEAGLGRRRRGRFSLTLDGLAVADGLAAGFDLGLGANGEAAG